jgi:hypothetical protein
MGWTVRLVDEQSAIVDEAAPRLDRFDAIARLDPAGERKR